MVQKGYQLKGKAVIIEKDNFQFDRLSKKLTAMTDGKFPFKSITKIKIDKAKPILAPKYVLYPRTTEEEQIESAKRAYGL